jgi:ABC-type multidrug transport system ATPase subunit
MNRAIEMMGLAKEYSGKRVIDDLSRDVEKGEIV